MKKKSNQRDRIINRINDRIKALKSKGYESYINLGEKIVNARIKFGATLTDNGRISKKSTSTLKQLRAIEKMIPTITRVNLKLDVTYQQQPAEYKQNVSRETFREQAIEIADFFENIEFFYADNSFETVEAFKYELKEHKSYSDVYNVIQKYKKMERIQ